MDDEKADRIGAARQGILSVEMAARVLFALERGGGPLTLNQIARLSGAQPSKIHRYLVSLGRTGLTSQSSLTGLYDLGPAMRRLGGAALQRTNEVAIASEYATRLRDATNHSVNLTAWGESGPVIIRWDYGAHALALTARVGATLPLLESGAGKAFLAYLPRTMTEQVLAAARGSDSGAVDAAALDTIRAEVRASGYATSVGEVIRGLYSLAAPIFTASDALPMVVTLVIPMSEVNDSDFVRVRDILLDTVKAASLELGYESKSDSRSTPHG